MNYIYVYPVDDFDRYADNETVIRAWQQGEAQRYTPEDFAELINDEMFCEVENWVRVIEED
jgi:histone acetyltransferase (RNA polymerase elongator complex component)